MVQILAFFVAKLPLPGTHPGALRRQHDLPNVGAAFHQCMRRGCLGKNERSIDHRLDPARGNQWPDLFFDRPHDRGLVRNRPGPQRRTRMGQALEQKVTKINGGARRGLKSDLHHAAIDRGRLIVALDVITADDVENDVGSLAGGLLFGNGDEILGPVVDGPCRTKGARGCAFFC